jgi:LPXTG-site transpeptidase (sortase) family protein
MDSALPGQPGNLVLSGHVSVADPRNLAVFSTLEEAAQGDVVQVFSGRDVHTYVVANVAVVSPDAVWFLRSDHTATVTLITCTRDLKNRVVVVGKLV